MTSSVGILCFTSLSILNRGYKFGAHNPSMMLVINCLTEIIGLECMTLSHFKKNDVM